MGTSPWMRGLRNALTLSGLLIALAHILECKKLALIQSRSSVTAALGEFFSVSE
jgi:hypothetical protein